MGSEKHDSRSDLPIAIIALTRRGVDLALQIRAKLSGSVCYVPERHRFALSMGAKGFERLGTVFPGLWAGHRALVCIMATGIVVRQIARLLHHKSSDPAVVVLDERGHYAISLLSGHLGGANRLAVEIAELVGGQAVITTATDVQKKPALDLIALDAGLEIENVETLSRLARAFLEDEPVWVFDPDALLRPYLDDQANVCFTDGGEEGEVPELAMNTPCIRVSERLAVPSPECLELRPRNLVVGVGCNRGTKADEILNFIREVFVQNRLSVLSIRNLASVNVKADEPGILEAARLLNRPIYFYSTKEIEGVPVPNPSDIVAVHIGVRSVCEATALLSGRTETLIVAKQKTANVTLAVARVGFSL